MPNPNTRPEDPRYTRPLEGSPPAGRGRWEKYRCRNGHVFRAMRQIKRCPEKNCLTKMNVVEL